MDRAQLHAQPVYGTSASSQQQAQYQYQETQPQPNYQPQTVMAPLQQDPYAHIKNLPLFPIWAQSDTDALNKAINNINRRRIPTNDIHAPMAHGSAAISASMMTKPRIELKLTRYATPSNHPFPGIIVDVLEAKGTSSWQGSGVAIRLRASRECCIMVRDKWKIRLKSGSMWSKNMNWKPVESISVETEKSVMAPLGMAGRWQRLVTVAERTEVWRRFEKDYKTPEIPGMSDIGKQS